MIILNEHCPLSSDKNDDFCNENSNNFDDNGNENDQKTDKYHGFLVKIFPF